MVFNIGVDSEKLERFEKKNFDKYCQKFLSEQERVFFKNLPVNKQQKFIASRFSSKEAIFKALGIGISDVKFGDITILPNQAGKPIVYFIGYDVELSITYNDSYVTTFVVLKKL